MARFEPDRSPQGAELVQNSLDAGARSIEIIRERIKGVPCLRVRDDGEGVIPELDRPEALRYIATHIGHSRKRSLTPSERFELMTQGQYGIGLLGFWCLGETLELRSSMPGQRAHRLVLTRDRPEYTIEPLRARLAFDERWTEVVVAGLHRAALPATIAGRAAEYLAAELRGQLLQRDVALEIHDRMSRGLAQKRVTVRPKRFLGERLAVPPRVEVPGHPPIALEIYLRGGDAGDDAAPGIGVYAAGTLVADDFHGLAPLDLDHLPWTDGRLAGLVDFPALHVSPGNRRGVIPDATAWAFAAALRAIEPELASILERFEQRRAESLDRAVIRDLQRAFRDFYQQRPRFTMLPVERKQDAAAGPPGDSAVNAGARDRNASDSASGGPAASESRDGSDSEDESPELPSLFPPGPLHEVRIVPGRIRLQCGGRRVIRARALDASGRRVTSQVRFRWSLLGSVGTLEPAPAATADVSVPASAEAAIADPASAGGTVITLLVTETPGVGTLVLEASSGARLARAEAPVEVLEEVSSSGRGSTEGIPEPDLFDEPGGRWRSRMVGQSWQVNSGHPDFRAIADRPGLKLRYLALLFAKEVVLRSTQDPRLDSPLEQLVEVAAYADRKLGERRPGRRRG